VITTRTPFRISFFGGGSDISGFYSRHPGAVLSVAINKSMYLTTHPYFEPTAIHLKYSKTELVHSVDRIEHPILRLKGVQYRMTGGERGWLGDSPFVHLDTTNLNALGWLPQVSIEQGIRNTVRYLQAHPRVLEKRT
jgi:hypothetical protein